MYLIYSTLALLEIAALFASVIGVFFLIVRSIVRAFLPAGPETVRPDPKTMHHLKRADARQPG